MKLLFNLLLLLLIILGFSASILNQYQENKISITFIEENHKSSGDQDSSVKNALDEVKFVSEPNRLYIVSMSNGKQFNFVFSKSYPQSLSISTHYSPPEQYI